MEEWITCLLKSLEDQGGISEKEKNDLYPSGSKPGVLYGLVKIYKALLKPLTNNEYTIMDSFPFAKEVLQFDSSLFMTSFDIKSLFTSIPLTEMLNLCEQNLYRNQPQLQIWLQVRFKASLKLP